MGVIDGHDVRALRERPARGAGCRTPGRRPHRDGQGQGLCPRRGGRPGGDGALACGQAEVDRQRRACARRAHRDALGAPPVAAPSTRRSSAKRWCSECERDERVVGITAAMNSGTGLNILQKAMPDRYFDVGIAEQQAVLFAAGLALRGSSPSLRSTRRSCSAPTTRSSTTCASRSSTSSSRWTARGSSATTARPITARSTSPTCAACRTSS